MKLLHLAAPGRNVGDNALIVGMRNIFHADTLQLVGLRQTTINNHLIDHINKNYDGVVIGGGGLLHATDGIRRLTQNSSGTLIMVDTNNLPKIKKPVIIYGVGYNVFNGEEGLCPLAKKSILDMMEYSTHFSVRNDGSKHRLSKFLGIPHDDIQEVPDPGLYCSYNNGEHEQLDNPSRKVAIQLAADRLQCRFKNNKEVYTFVEEIKTFIEKVDSKCWLVPHTPDDERFIASNFKGCNIYPLKTKLEDAGSVMGFYKKMDCVIGQRGHANICPFGLGIPIISLVSHKKNLGFMEQINFAEYAISCDDPQLHVKLLNRLDSIDQDYVDKQATMITKMQETSKQAIREIHERM